MWAVSGSPSRRTAMTSAAEFAGNGIHTSLPSHCLIPSGSLPPFTWLCEKSPSRNSVDWHTQHVAKPAQPVQYDQFIYRGLWKQPRRLGVFDSCCLRTIGSMGWYNGTRNETVRKRVLGYAQDLTATCKFTIKWLVVEDSKRHLNSSFSSPSLFSLFNAGHGHGYQRLSVDVNKTVSGCGHQFIFIVATLRLPVFLFMWLKVLEKFVLLNHPRGINHRLP
ncbi:hypothetical protein T265_02315 [Opisthorchis viverrini]|uniref:Uncharacterized protein n=1 Tax=Opisthorchis viverrini TaxID=6198 RepID=A0A075AIC6_OPIVI|nr:hypothetical protein T265_02315 [Opisthorchis viverrini]KER31399.1 hypothetical protein T265_02315 [Opisthorchis viverrini]